MSYDKFITRYDRAGTFFYLDPPYYGNENDYGKNIFSREDFYRLSSLLSVVKGKFIVSLNDKPEVREIFKQYDILTLRTKYQIGKHVKDVSEVLIKNY